MHDDDGTHGPLPDPHVVVVPCEVDGSCLRSDLAAALEAASVRWIWLVADGSEPAPAPAEAHDGHPGWVTLHPMTDAVKRIDDHDVVLGTVDRSMLRIVRPPALLPRVVGEVAIERAEGDRCNPLHDALALGIELRPLPGA